MKVAWSIVSALCCATVIAWGSIMILAEGASREVLGYGVVTASYGVLILLLLLIGWRSPRPRLAGLAAGLGLVFLTVWTVASFDYGSLSPLEQGGVALSAIIAALNWRAVQVVVAV